MHFIIAAELLRSVSAEALSSYTPENKEQAATFLIRAVEVFSRWVAIRRIPWYPSKWKVFTREIEHLAEEMGHLETEIRRLEERPSNGNGHHRAAAEAALAIQAKIRELRREVRKREQAAGA